MFTPRLRIYDHVPNVTHPPFAQDMLEESIWNQSLSAPGVRANMRRLPLSREKMFLTDPLGDQIPFMPYCLMPTYKVQFKDRGLSDWTIIPSDQDAAARVTAIAYYQTTLTALQAIKNPTTDDLAQITFCQAQIAALGPNAPAWLLETYNQLGTGCLEIDWSLAVADIPVRMVSNWALEQDRAFTIRLARFLPLVGQYKPELAIKISNGQTQYALVFTKEETVEWRHYANMTPSARKTLENQLAEVNQLGSLTPMGYQQAQTLRTQIVLLKQQMRGGASPAQAAQLASLNSQLQTLVATSQGLTKYDQEIKQNLEAQIYLDRQPVRAAEDMRSLFNCIFDVTFEWLRRGYVSITISQTGTGDPWTWENRNTTNAYSYSTQLPPNCHLAIESNGGRFLVGYGHPQYQSQAQLFSQPFAPGYTIEDDEWVMAMDAIGSADYDPDTPNILALPGVSIDQEVVEISAGASAGPGTGSVPASYQLQLTLNSLKDDGSADGRYCAQVYRAEFYAPAGEPPEWGDPVWDSAPNNETFGTCIMELMMQEQENRAALHEVHIRDWPGSRSLPLDLEGRGADLSLVDSTTGLETYIVTQGILTEPDARDIQDNTAVSETLSFDAKIGTERIVKVMGPEYLLNHEIDSNAQIVGNGLNVGDYLILLFRNAGFRVDQLTGIPSGSVAGLEQLPPVKAGMPPDIKPQIRKTYLEFATRLLIDHALGWRLIMQPEVGPVLQQWLTARERPDLMYDSTASYDSGLRIYGKTDNTEGLQLVQDTKDFYTSYQVVGALDPLTGKRYTFTESIPQSTDPSFKGLSLFYIGVPKPFYAEPNDSFRSKALCAQAARAYRYANGRPPWFIHATVDLNPTLRCGDVPRFNGRRAIIVEIQRQAINAGRGQRIRLVTQLMDDTPIQTSLI